MGWTQTNRQSSEFVQVCVHVCVCVFIAYTALSLHRWLAFWSQQQSDSTEAEASSILAHSGAADQCSSNITINKQYSSNKQEGNMFLHNVLC